MPFPEANTEQLTIATFPMICPAWWVLDLSPLWTRGTLVGDDLEIPGGATIPMRKRLPPKRVVLPMAIGGDVNASGTPYDDGLVGIEENVDALEAIFAHIATGNGTRPLVLTRASGAQWGADVHVIGLDLGAVTPAGAMNATLELSIPAGKLSEVVTSS